MTKLLVRVVDAGEAVAAAAAGFDIVELCLQGIDEAEIAAGRAVRLAFPGLLRLRLVGPGSSHDRVQRAFTIGADELATTTIEVFPSRDSTVDSERPARISAVALLTVAPDTAESLRKVRQLCDRVMIESGTDARLFDRAGITELAALADACRFSGLPFGFSGGLEAPDIARLLLLGPEVLGFDTAVRSDHKNDGALLPHLLDAIRALIPRHGLLDDQPRGATVQDTIFVRDFVVALSVGAYRAEEGARQRVRFSVEAVVARRAGPPRDMRDVVSYDVILETIRVLAERSHVAFVEALAEEVAASLLTHAAIESVTVQVEKLDVVKGSVGVAISRRRT